MSASLPKIPIDRLLEIIRAGGSLRTGFDIVNKQGRLILEEDVLVDNEKQLLNIKSFGVEKIPIVTGNNGGMWNRDGIRIEHGSVVDIKQSQTKKHTSQTKSEKIVRKKALSEIDRKIDELIELKEVATEKYSRAKGCVKQVFASIVETGGEFEFEVVEDTVSDLFEFVSENENAFSYLTKEIFSYDDYLYNHSINVCAIGTVILKKFNENFSSIVNNMLSNSAINSMRDDLHLDKKSFSFYMPDEMRDISTGFFMHDMGKTLVDKEVLNKPGKLTEREFEEVKSHSISKGVELLEKNKLVNPYIKNISLYHHAQLFDDEERCYPKTKKTREIPPYVKVCKLADIYDALTSKRCYKEALNPVGVVTDIFHKYAEKDILLQYILHAFVKSVGIYPPGSIVVLTNGQMAYVLDSKGPTLLPITDSKGVTLQKKQDMMVLTKGEDPKGIKVDRRKPPLSPVDAFKMLPDYLTRSIFPENV